MLHTYVVHRTKSTRGDLIADVYKPEYGRRKEGGKSEPFRNNNIPDRERKNNNEHLEGMLWIEGANELLLFPGGINVCLLRPLEGANPFFFTLWHLQPSVQTKHQPSPYEVRELDESKNIGFSNYP